MDAATVVIISVFAILIAVSLGPLWTPLVVNFSWCRKPSAEVQMVLALLDSCAERDWKTSGYGLTYTEWVHPCGITISSHQSNPDVTVKGSALVLRKFESRLIAKARKRLIAEWHDEGLRKNLLDASREIEARYGRSADVFDIATGTRAN